MLPIASTDLGDAALLVGSFATLLTALGSFIVIVVKLNRSGTTLKRVDHSLNNIAYDGNDDTLAQRVQKLAVAVQHGFERNVREHALLRGLLRDHDEAIAEVQRRVDALGTDPEETDAHD